MSPKRSRLLKPATIPSGLYTGMTLFIVAAPFRAFGGALHALGNLLVFVGAGFMIATVVAEWREVIRRRAHDLGETR